MRVICRIRKLNDDRTGPAEPEEVTTVEGEADRYEDARDIAAAKVPDGWQRLAWDVPEHLPG